MKLWVDEWRSPPDNKTWRVARSVWEAMNIITDFENGTLEDGTEIEVIDLAYDAGDYADEGGNYINLLEWLEMCGATYDLHFHTTNPAGRKRMEVIARRNHWIVR